MESASPRITKHIKSIGGWRGETLARVRELILAALPDVVEEWKWDIPVWSHNGILCTGETYKQVVKLTFAHGASLSDPSGLFNSSLQGNTRRAIDIREGEKLNATAFKALIKAAARRNGASAAAKGKAKSSAKKKSTPTRLSGGKSAPKPQSGGATPVKLLSSGNPQIAKADGDAPVQMYIGAMPGWKRAVGAQLDALIVRAVPKLHKAVKWNTPLYGAEGKGFFLGFYCFAHYVQVTFFNGTSLRPMPPKASKVEGTRYFEIREGDVLDEAQMTKWVKQAAALPGFLAPK